MVINFAKRQGAFKNLSHDEIINKVKNGDLSVVLKSYEYSIQKPILGALHGKLYSFFIKNLKDDGQVWFIIILYLLI